MQRLGFLYRQQIFRTGIAAFLLLSLGLLEFNAQAQSVSKPKRKNLRKPDVIFVPTPPETVEEMLRLARIKKGDVLYDLGSGDGRIPIRAAEEYGIHAVGIDIDPKMIAVAEEAAHQAGVADKVRFRNEDLFRANIREATIVTLYLSDVLNLKLRPKLLQDLRPGTRIISHDFRMGDWKPKQIVRVPWKTLYRTVYVWTVPPGGRIKTEVDEPVK
jgi:SAM-dependent methyltransferase